MDSRTKHDSHTKIVQRPAVFDKLENLVRDMQDSEHGVPVRSQKLFLTSIPAAFMGYDLIEWLMDRLSIEDSLEAVHLANLLCQFGYYFPINELKNLLVKDDSSLYRFQSPYYWPSQNHTPDNIEYAIYLAKRSQHRNRQKHSLEDYEVEAYNNLKKILSSRWEFVTMQAEEQLKIAKDRKKGDKIITDSQEKAYWRVYRPPPGYTTVVESSPVPTREQRIKARSRTREHLREEAEFMRNYLAMSRAKVSVVAEGLLEYTDIFTEFDAFLSPVGPSNPWVTDDQTYWCLNQPIVDCPTEKRVKKWGIGLDYLVSDTLGLQELLNYMKKEYSHENLRFWLAVQELRMGPGSESSIKKKVKEIWEEFLSPGAKAEINIDGKTMEATREAMKNPSRFTFETTAGHVYTFLIKKDCYPRFIRSESYKTLLANAVNPGNQKKRFFSFGPVKKKISCVVPPGAGVPVAAGPCSTAAGSSGTKITLEDFNIHGATGEVSDSPPECHPDKSEPRVRSKSPPPATAAATTSKEDWIPGVDPPHRSRRDSRTTVIAGEEGTLLLIDGPPHSHSHPHSHHHHHHHHHHHNSPSSGTAAAVASSASSKRLKSRSNKRKKAYRTGANSKPADSVASDMSDMVLEAKEDLTHAHTSASSPPSPSCEADVTSATTLVVETSSKCTQTKSEDAAIPLTTASRHPLTPPSSPRINNPLEHPRLLPTTSSNNYNSKEEEEEREEMNSSPSLLEQQQHGSQDLHLLLLTDKVPPGQTVLTQQTQGGGEDGGETHPLAKESRCSKPEECNSSKRILLEEKSKGEGEPSDVDAAVAVGGSGSGDIEATWTSSTEVCPWEDEKNCKDSHAPFVKTYATLGYL